MSDVLPEKHTENLMTKTEDCGSVRGDVDGLATDEAPTRDHAVLRLTDGFSPSSGGANRDFIRRDQRYASSSSGMLSSFVMQTRPVATNVRAAAGDDQLVFYFTDVGKVWCLLFCVSSQLGAAARGRAVPLPSEDCTEFVSLAYKDGLLWALDSKRRILFRAGQSDECPIGLSWGVMLSDEDTPTQERGLQVDSSLSLDSCVVDSQGRFIYDSYSTRRLPHEPIVTPPSSSSNGGGCNNSKSYSQNISSSNNNNNIRSNFNQINNNNNNQAKIFLGSPDNLHSENDQLVSLSSTPEMHSIFTNTFASIDVLAQPSGSSTTSYSVSENCDQSFCTKNRVMSITISGGEVGWRVTACGSVAFRPDVSPFIPQGANTKWWEIVKGGDKIRCENWQKKRSSSWRKTVEHQAGNNNEPDTL
ncbi:hypothetical protein FHG87_007794 [Trinorchestia longiramus]|nr:hypothetical protein FHG87_007794 [Trinorchestia longiramus]